MPSGDNIRRGRNIVYALIAHLVVVPKCPSGFITDRVREQLRGPSIAVIADFGGKVSEMGGKDGRVPWLMAFTPRHSLSAGVNSLKGVSRSLAALRQRFDLPTLPLPGVKVTVLEDGAPKSIGASLADDVLGLLTVVSAKLGARAHRPKATPTSTKAQLCSTYVRCRLQ